MRTSFLKPLVESRFFERCVVVMIVLNAVTLGLETYPALMATYGPTLYFLDRFFLSFFVIELGLRISVWRTAFFREGWNWFDFIIVVLTLLPSLGVPGLGNLSAFRALRLLRLLSVVPSFRRVLRGIVRALQGSFAVMCVLGIILYVFSVVSVKLFQNANPTYFADLDTAFFTFFQIMTLDAWSDIVRPLMVDYPWAGLYFVSFIVTTVFILLSIIIGVAANAVEAVAAEEEKERAS
jgi:voltage-gated sodium channel